MNKVILVGRLTKDPELRTTTSGISVTSFTVAIDRPYSDKSTGEKTADFIPVVVWREKAESVKKYVSKGSLVGVEGRIQTRSYDDQNGVKKYITEVLADNVTFLESKNNNDQSQRQNPVRNQKEENDDESKYDNVKFTNDDLPF